MITDINKLKKEIKILKLNEKSQEVIFKESLRIFRESQGKQVESDSKDSLTSDLAEKEGRLQQLLEYKNNLHILANNSNITLSTINILLGSSTFDSSLRSYFQRILVTSIDRFKSKPKNRENTEFSKPLSGLPRYRKLNQLLTLEFTNQSYRFLRNNKNKIIGIKLGKTFKNISLKTKFSDEFFNNNVKINNIALTPVSQYSMVDGKFYLIINYEYNKLVPLPDFKNKVGIDVNLSDLVVTSDGEKFKYPNNSIEKIENRRNKLQSYLSHKKRLNRHWKKSNRYRKLKNKVDKLYAKEKNIRENFYHQVSRHLINKYDVITMEDLDIINMMKK